MTTQTHRDLRHTTGDLARLTGTTLRTVRYYESMGLLSPAERSGGGHRMFSDEDVARLQTITDLRSVGIALCDVARILNVRDSAATTREEILVDVGQVLDEQLKAVRERLNTLNRVERDLLAARKIVDKCCACALSAEKRPCGHCETYQSSLPNPWVSEMLPQRTRGGDDDERAR